MKYKFQDELLMASEGLVQLLSDEGIVAEVIEDSFRDYTVKVSVLNNGIPAGNINLYYSPKKDLYSFRTYELKDKSVLPELEKCWQQMSTGATDVTQTEYQIYVDGSFLNDLVGYGLVILKNNQVVTELSGSVSDTFAQGTRNIAGELFAVEEAIGWCKQNGVREISIYYDYKGIEKWASGEWKAKIPLTRRYAEFVRKSQINIYWHKIAGHTGNKWNERADELAKAEASSISAKSGSQHSPNTELENKSKGFATFLMDSGYVAEFKGIYGNPHCAKIQVYAADKNLGFMNIYCTKKEPFLPKYHEIKDQSHRDKLEILWREYHYGERLLPL